MSIVQLPARAVRSLRSRGIIGSLGRLRNLVYRTDQMYVLVTHIEPASPEHSLESREIGDLVLRPTRESDTDELADLLPKELNPGTREERLQQIASRVGDGVIAVREGRTVGAAWHLDDVSGQEPWFNVVRQFLREPVRRSAVIFVVPGKAGRGVSWHLGQFARNRSAARGARSLVSTIRIDNTPSLVSARMAGAQVVALWRMRWRFGKPSHQVTTLSADAESECSPKSAGTAS